MSDTEIELKYEGKNTEMGSFVKGALETIHLLSGTTEHTRTDGANQLDSFYETPPTVTPTAGGKVIRFRRNVSHDPLGHGRKSELTIKTRTSDDSLMHRKEYDLFVTNPDEVHAFMVASGNLYLFTLTKDFVVITGEILEHGKYVEIEFSWYSARQCKRNGKDLLNTLVPKTQFIEVEAKKGSVPTDVAMAAVGRAGATLSERLMLGQPLNVSLFELFNKNHVPEAY